MANQFSDGETYADVRSKLNAAIAQLNTARRDWFPTFDGDRCYHAGKSWDLATSGQRTETPGTGSGWNEVGSTAPGTVTIEAFTVPSGNQITSPNTSFGWTTDSTKTYQSYVINVYDDGTQIYNASGTTKAHTVNGLPLDGSNIRVDIALTYAEGIGALSRTFTTSAGTAPATWSLPANGSTAAGSNVTAQWVYGTKQPQNWTLTVTNNNTSSIINTYTGTTAASQVVAGLPDNGESITLSLGITFTDTTTQTLASTITNGAASSNPLVTMTGTGATISGEIVVAGGIAQWASSASSASGNQQTNFPTGGGPVTVTPSAGTIVGVRMANAGISSLVLDASATPSEFDLKSNASLSIGIGDVDWTAATILGLKDVGAGVLLRDADIPNPGNVTYFDVCNAPGVTVTGPKIGQMTNLTYLCLQAVGIGLTDAHMSGVNYAAMQNFLGGYNGNVVITEATTNKMPNLQLFHVPYSGTTVTPGMFTTKAQLSNIDVAGNTIITQGAMDNVLEAIKLNAQANGINGGTLKILADNPVPTNGASNVHRVALEAIGWTVS